MDRKNINRGFKKLRVWQDAIDLYVLAYKIFSKFPFELNKVAANSIDAAHSISRNISEGQPFVWHCHDCHQGVVTPSIYINIHGETVKIDPNAPEAHKKS